MRDALIVTTRSVDWYPVHRLVAPFLTAAESWPVAGTLPWQDLNDTDPAKWCAVLDAAQYGALHMQLRQEALARASRDISSTDSWTSVAHQHLRHHTAVARGLYIPRKAS